MSETILYGGKDTGLKKPQKLLPKTANQTAKSAKKPGNAKSPRSSVIKALPNDVLLTALPTAKHSESETIKISATAKEFRPTSAVRSHEITVTEPAPESTHNGPSQGQYARSELSQDARSTAGTQVLSAVDDVALEDQYSDGIEPFDFDDLDQFVLQSCVSEELPVPALTYSVSELSMESRSLQGTLPYASDDTSWDQQKDETMEVLPPSNTLRSEDLKSRRAYDDHHESGSAGDKENMERSSPDFALELKRVGKTTTKSKTILDDSDIGRAPLLDKVIWEGLDPAVAGDLPPLPFEVDNTSIVSGTPKGAASDEASKKNVIVLSSDDSDSESEGFETMSDKSAAWESHRAQTMIDNTTKTRGLLESKTDSKPRRSVMAHSNVSRKELSIQADHMLEQRPSVSVRNKKILKSSTTANMAGVLPCRTTTPHAVKAMSVARPYFDEHPQAQAKITGFSEVPNIVRSSSPKPTERRGQQILVKDATESFSSHNPPAVTQDAFTGSLPRATPAIMSDSRDRRTAAAARKSKWSKNNSLALTINSPSAHYDKHSTFSQTRSGMTWERDLPLSDDLPRLLRHVDHQDAHQPGLAVRHPKNMRESHVQRPLGVSDGNVGTRTQRPIALEPTWSVLPEDCYRRPHLDVDRVGKNASTRQNDENMHDGVGVSSDLVPAVAPEPYGDSLAITMHEIVAVWSSFQGLNP